MALMSLGMFIFDLPTIAYDQLQRRTTWRHPTSSRVLARPAAQYVGPGEDTITLTGKLAPLLIGDASSLDQLRELADSGEAWPLLDGRGLVYGAFVITGLDETQRAIMDDGWARVSDFTITLQRVEDDDNQDPAAPEPVTAATPADDQVFG